MIRSSRFSKFLPHLNVHLSNFSASEWCFPTRIVFQICLYSAINSGSFLYYCSKFPLIDWEQDFEPVLVRKDSVCPRNSLLFLSLIGILFSIFSICLLNLFFFSHEALWAAVSLGSFEYTKNSHRKIWGRSYRSATSIVGSYSFPTSHDLSNNRVHDKVLLTNFYCFKFIIINASAHFKIHHCFVRNAPYRLRTGEKNLYFSDVLKLL